MHQIILCRHAATEALEIKKGTDTMLAQRQNDSLLSRAGTQEAERMGKTLNINGYRWDAVLTSMFSRSRKTGEILNNGKKKPLIIVSEFNEYYVSSEGRNLETVTVGTARTMGKLYELFQVFDSVLIVGHKSINPTIMRSLLNCTYQRSLRYFHNTMETVALRYNWKLGDTRWKILDHFKS